MALCQFALRLSDLVPGGIQRLAAGWRFIYSFIYGIPSSQYMLVLFVYVLS